MAFSGEVAVNKERTGFLERYAKLSSLDYPVPAHGSRLPYTLGGITFLGFMILFVSGFLLQQFFDPAPERAYQSVKHLVAEVPGGRFLRALHYWTAQAVVASLLLHVARVFITGAYKAPRTLTWYFGVALLGTALFGSYFTGTVLKWDQESFDALVHYREILKLLGSLGAFLGSTDAVSLNTKLFSSHVSILPLLLVALIGGHFYLVHVLNLSPLAFGEDSAHESLPPARMTGTLREHTRSILVYGAIYFSLVAIVAWLVPAPLGEPVSGEEQSIKPPWPFLWLYGMENLTGRMDTLFYGMAAFLLLLALVPLIDRGAERNPRHRKSMVVAGVLGVALLSGLTLYASIAPPQLHHHEHGGMADMDHHEHDDGAEQHHEHGDATTSPSMAPDLEGGHKEDGHTHSH